VPPTGTAGDAVVVIVGLAGTTVDVEEPLPKPTLPVTLLVAWAEPSCLVWTPGVPGSTSADGTLSTFTVKSIRQVEVADPGGPRATGEAETKETSPVAGLTTTMLNVWPAQAVPGSPTPVGLSWNTPGSAIPPEQLELKLEHDGTSFMELKTRFPTLSGEVDELVTVKAAGSPVCPTTTGEDVPGKALGPAPNNTPAARRCR